MNDDFGEALLAVDIPSQEPDVPAYRGTVVGDDHCVGAEQWFCHFVRLLSLEIYQKRVVRVTGDQDYLIGGFRASIGKHRDGSTVRIQHLTVDRTEQCGFRSFILPVRLEK